MKNSFTGILFIVIIASVCYYSVKRTNNNEECISKDEYTIYSIITDSTFFRKRFYDPEKDFVIVESFTKTNKLDSIIMYKQNKVIEYGDLIPVDEGSNIIPDETANLINYFELENDFNKNNAKSYRIRPELFSINHKLICLTANQWKNYFYYRQIPVNYDTLKYPLKRFLCFAAFSRAGFNVAHDQAIVEVNRSSFGGFATYLWFFIKIENIWNQIGCVGLSMGI